MRGFNPFFSFVLLYPLIFLQGSYIQYLILKRKTFLKSSSVNKIEETGRFRYEAMSKRLRPFPGAWRAWRPWKRKGFGMCSWQSGGSGCILPVTSRGFQRAAQRGKGKLVSIQDWKGRWFQRTELWVGPGGPHSHSPRTLASFTSVKW